MQLFTRKKEIPVNLDDIELDRLMTLPRKEEADSKEFYVKEIFNKDHIQIGIQASKVYYDGIHDFKYDRSKKELVIFSRFKKSAFLLYASLILPLLPFFIGENVEGVKLKIIGLALGWFIFISLILILGIRSQSKEIEREMTIRINYFRGTMN